MLNFQTCIFIVFQSLLYPICLFFKSFAANITKGFRAIANTRQENNHKENNGVQMKMNKSKINKKVGSNQGCELELELELELEELGNFGRTRTRTRK